MYRSASRAAIAVERKDAHPQRVLPALGLHPIEPRAPRDDDEHEQQHGDAQRFPHDSGDRSALLRLQTRSVPGPDAEEAIRLRCELARPAGAIVNAPLALDPQLDRIRPESIPAPVGRSGDDKLRVGFIGRLARIRNVETLGRGRNGFLQRFPRGHRCALLARPSTDAALPGTRGKVSVAVRCRGLLRRVLRHVPAGARRPSE